MAVPVHSPGYVPSLAQQYCGLTCQKTKLGIMGLAGPHPGHRKNDFVWALIMVGFWALVLTHLTLKFHATGNLTEKMKALTLQGRNSKILRELYTGKESLHNDQKAASD